MVTKCKNNYYSFHNMIFVFLETSKSPRPMKKRESISNIMAPNSIDLNLNDGLAQVENLFKKHKMRHSSVVN